MRGYFDFLELAFLVGVLGVIFLATFTGAFDCGMGTWSKNFC